MGTLGGVLFNLKPWGSFPSSQLLLSSLPPSPVFSSPVMSVSEFGCGSTLVAPPKRKSPKPSKPSLREGHNAELLHRGLPLKNPVMRCGAFAQFLHLVFSFLRCCHFHRFSCPPPKPFICVPTPSIDICHQLWHHQGSYPNDNLLRYISKNLGDGIRLRIVRRFLHTPCRFFPRH